MSVTHNIAVLLPCYNEASIIAKVIADFQQALPNATVMTTIQQTIPAK